ncbi:DUF5693 family protein [Thermotoga sp. 38H-to]|uniref:DUF5693 family protein n=1 Tax=Thermotoga sp. 38H-to TaxID=1755812 RepID=UPI0013EDEE63|nr:DUF5693 family protein [Thermotoga sp. 38H-to]KAF2959099.1 hypothetical protein AS158_08625 [Thermotoga sp. 38H-to]
MKKFTNLKNSLFLIFLVSSVVLIVFFLPERFSYDRKGLVFSFLFDDMIDGKWVVLFDLSSKKDLPPEAKVVILKGEPLFWEPQELAEKLKGKWVGIVEFDPSYDFARKVALLKKDGLFFRVHTVKPEEIEKLNLDEEALFHRYKRAVLERSVEVLWIRNIKEREILVQRLASYFKGKVVPFPALPESEPFFPKWIFLIPPILLITSLNPLLLSVVFVLPFSREWFVSLLFVSGTLAAYFVPKKKWLKVLSFLLLSISLSLSLSDLYHLNGILDFRGVKLSLVLLPGLLFLSGLWKNRRNWKKYLPLLFLAIPVGFYYLMRSGNSGWVLEVERKFRDWLESVLMVRPRFKEIVCYPFFWLEGFREYDFLRESFGSVALVSMFNTFCHVKTPLVVSIYRSTLGLAIGYTVFFFLKVFLNRFLTSK